MNLDKLTVNIKPLPVYQAIDLGMSVARAWYGDLWQLGAKRLFWWLGIALGMMGLGLWWSKAEDSLVWVYLMLGLVYWFKPLYERPMMIYLSQKLFDESYQLEQVPDTARTMPKVNFLLYQRFSSQRPLVMAVHLLERQTGKDARLRLKALTRRQSRSVSSHASAFFVIEVMLTVVAFNVFSQIFTFGSGLGGEVSMDLPEIWSTVSLLVFYIISVSLVMPFFVASGFVLYLCKRSHLEGWDIELVFVKLRQRYLAMQNKENP